jgi:nucleoside-diphosphate-sugar epimerase
MIAFFSARTRVRIDKARRLLGYEPEFSLDRGMALTAAWARWANVP